jgi:hypothetical protein
MGEEREKSPDRGEDLPEIAKKSPVPEFSKVERQDKQAMTLWT